MTGAPRELRGSAIVSGGASGLGRACVERLRVEGMPVLAADVNDDAGRALADADAGIAFRRTDVTDVDEVTAAVEQAAALSPDGLRLSVACAGIGPPERLLGRRGPHSVDRFLSIVTINLFGTFLLLRGAAEAMAGNEPIEGERGLHVSTASAAAYEGQIGQVAYSASKGGVVGLTLPAARDLAQYGIRVCSIAPGLFATPLLGSLPDEVKASLEASIPFPPRFGRPEEFADLVVAIARNGMLNGETIRLDGAIRLAPR
jgi:3-hydroxyacyl-CoA dehydrogenase / 3-hydroxy-2-methylbutyryl-CoA dehydrogenase